MAKKNKTADLIKQYEKAKEAKEREIADLAERTIEWVKRNGLWRFRFDSEQEIGGYFIIVPSRFKSGKPIWAEEFETTVSVWKYVREYLLGHGIPVCKNRHGHYFGYAGEQGASYVTSTNTGISHLLSAEKQEDYAIMTAGWNTFVALAEEKLAKRTGDLSLANLRRARQNFLATVLPAHQTSLADALLETENKSDRNSP